MFKFTNCSTNIKKKLVFAACLKKYCRILQK